MVSRLRLKPAGPPAGSIRSYPGIGRSTSDYAEQVSDALRGYSSPGHLRPAPESALTLP